MKQTAILFLIITSHAFAEENVLIGTWRSDEIKTLESMNSNPNVNEKSRELFSNDFFGKLEIHYKEKEYRNYIPGETDDLEQFNKYHPYEIISRNGNILKVKSYNTLSEQFETSKIYLEGNCYYIHVSKWEFREYFCKKGL